MRILLLQLSDLHIRNQQSIESLRIEKILSVLNAQKAFDCVTIILSGDLAYSGKREEYILVDDLIIEMKKRISYIYKKCVNVEVLIVPGNHDIDFKEKKRYRDDILNLLKDKEIIDYEKEAGLQQNFLEFVTNNGLFKRSSLFDIININYNGIKVRYNLFNSAFFSAYSDNKDNEIALHHFPNEVFEGLNQFKEHANIEISIIHHSLNWFNEETRKALIKEFQNNSNFVFLGHEHSHSITKNIDHFYEESKIIMGGAFTYNNKSFCITILDTDDLEAESIEYVYNKSDDLYLPNKNNKEKFIFNKRENFFKVDDTFLNDIRKDDHFGDSTNFDEYFVCPEIKLDLIDEIELKEISDINLVLEFIQKNDLITILGSSLSGKTSLLKKIYLEMVNSKYIPIYINSREMKDKSIDSIIKSSLDNQYVNKRNIHERYKQMNKENKILFIDDIHLIKTSFITVLNDLSITFDKIIVTSDKEFNFNIKDQIKETFTSNIKQVNFIIQSLHYKKRKNLIRKYLEYMSHGIQKISDFEIKKINDMISTQLSLISSTPYTVISIVKHFKQLAVSEGSSKSIFNKVFEMNITKMLSKTFSKNKIDMIFMILEELGYMIHFNKKYPIYEDDIFDIIKNYNDEYIKNVSKSETVQKLIECKLLRKDSDNKITFYDKNVLAYYVARSLLRKSDEVYIIDKFNYLLKNVCFGINNTILLFVSYLTLNNKVLEHIILEIMSKFDSWPEFEFLEETIEFLNTKINTAKIDVPTNGDYDKDSDNRDKEEKDSEEMKYDVIDIYDYDENESDTDMNLITSAFKSLEILSQILPSFEYQMKKDIKNAYIEMLYTFPNKIFDQIFQPIKANYYDFLVDLSKDSNVKILKMDVQVKNILLTLLIRMYSYVGARIATEETIVALNKFNYNDKLNYKIENLIFQAKIKDDKVLFDKADLFYEDTKSHFIKGIYSSIVKRYFIDYQLPTKGSHQAYADKYFLNSKKSTMIKKISAKKK